VAWQQTMSKPSKVPRGRSYQSFAFAQMFYEIPKWMNDLDCPLSHGRSFNKGCVTLWPCPIYIKKSILRQKTNYGKLKYFTLQKYNLQKKPS
jgi:hypothetical protein